MGNAIVSKLLVQDSSTQAHFIEGIGDTKVPLDVQALGAMYLRLRNDNRASQVAVYLQNRMYLGDRSVAGTRFTLSGYLPFLGTTAPQVVWSEGTLEANVALARLGINDASAIKAGLEILATTQSGTIGPIGADRDVIDSEWGEYHTWPTSAVGSWLLIASSSANLLFAH
jgi:hypothetical protein